MMKAEEALALANKYTDEHGGGGGGTTNYNQLSNKPKINDVELSGNKSASDLGLMPEYEVDTTPTESSENLITSGGVWSADKNIKDKLQGSKTAGSTDGSPFEIPDYGMTESIQMYFKPTQDLHGYDKPWAGGAGKNKLPYFTAEENNGIRLTYDDGVAVLDGTSSANAFFTLSNLNLTSNNYVFSANNDTANSGVHISLREIGASSDFADLPINDTDKHNFYQNVSIGQVTLYVLSGTQLTNFRLPLQIEVGDSKTSFEPYSNICPISGQDNATFEWTGKNKIDDEYSEEYTNTVKLGAGTYYYQGFVSDTSNVNTRLQYSKDGTNWNTVGSTPYSDTGISVIGWDGGWSASGTYTATIETTTPLYFRVWKVNEVLENRRLSISDTELTAYARYIHGELTMNFGNTYYGGFCQFNGQIYPDWDYIASYNGETLSGEWVSDRDEYVAGTTPTIGAEVAYKTTPSYARVTPPANLSLTDDYPIEYNGYMAQIGYQPKNTVLAEAKKYTNQAIEGLGLPQPPTTDGTYHLECSVSGGIPTIRWVSNS